MTGSVSCSVMLVVLEQQWGQGAYGPKDLTRVPANISCLKGGVPCGCRYGIYFDVIAQDRPVRIDGIRSACSSEAEGETLTVQTYTCTVGSSNGNEEVSSPFHRQACSCAVTQDAKTNDTC